MLRHSLKRSSSRFRGHFFSTQATKSGLQIRVNSIDHDSCFGLPYRAPNEMDASHAAVIALMNAQKKEHRYAYDYVMSFSNRQSARRDCLNALYNRNNLAFPVAMFLAKALGAYFDPFLLADIDAYQKPGFNITLLRNELIKRNISIFDSSPPDEVLQEVIANYSLDYIFSQDKINIIYAQAHRMALIHPNASISFNIYDDLIQEVLQPASEFYERYPSLLPHNAIFNFYHFCTTDDLAPLPEKLFTINGKGAIDSAYYETVTAMGQIAQSEEGEQISTYHMADYLSPHKIHRQRQFNFDLGCNLSTGRTRC